MPDDVTTEETTETTTQAAAVRYRVTATVLNVRAGPSIEDPVIGAFDEGDVVEWLSTSDDGYWLEVGAGELRGWCSHKYLLREVPPEEEEFPWMAIARAEEGERELPGNADNNPRIVEYLHSTNLGAPLDSVDETAWCSAFVNWCVESAGYEGTDSAWARSWLTWGVALETPRRGCVVVLSRGQGAGHVGFYVDESEHDVSLLGGNQADSVCVSAFRKDRVLGYRAPAS